MKSVAKLVILGTAVALSAVVTPRGYPSAEASVYSTGKHYACFNGVAIRDKPDGPAKDNLSLHQTFVVTGSVGGNYVYGYKLVNGLHGLVKSTSIDKSCGQ